MVDIPELIEGAHAGSGLGDRFLRHVERTRVLLHLMDGNRERDEILADKATIENELRLWNAALLDRPILNVVTKLDIPESRTPSPVAAEIPKTSGSPPRRASNVARFGNNRVSSQR